MVPTKEESTPTAGQNESASQFEKTEGQQPPQAPDVPENIPSEEAATPAEENNIEEEVLIELNRADKEQPVMDLVDLDEHEVDNQATNVPGTPESERIPEPGEDQVTDPSGSADQPVEVPEMDTLFTIEDEDEPATPAEASNRENYTSEAHSFSGWLKRLQDKRQRVEKPDQSALADRGEEERIRHQMI
ncbi:MAG: hypothetical protein U5L96_14410 [Owenweeksia sp.]|nr:hypothetical protein [Owenweeksia sp.]